MASSSMDEYIDELLAESSSPPVRKQGGVKRMKDRGGLPTFLLHKEFANKFLRDYRTVVPLDHGLEGDPLSFLSAMEPSIETLIKKDLTVHDGIKYSAMLTVEFEKLGPTTENNEADTTIKTTVYFRTKAYEVLNAGATCKSVQEAKATILKHLEGYTREGSGWRVKRVVALDIGTARYKPIRGNSYFPTPKYLPPQSVINVQNNDNRCFEWAVLSAMYPAEQNPHRPSKYRAHLKKLDFTGIKFPVEVTSIDKFERQNLGVSVCVFGWNKGLYPLRVSNQNTNYIIRNVDLLLLADGENQHYVWIKDLGRIINKHNKHEHKLFPCRRCIHPFSRQDLLLAHIKDCKGISDKPQRIVIPEEGKNILKFQNHHKQMRVPYINYADFEALNIPVKNEDLEETNTRLIAEQKPCSFCYIVVRSDGLSHKLVLYRGENAVEEFLNRLQGELANIKHKLANAAKMVMTETDHQSFREATECHICGDALERQNKETLLENKETLVLDKVRD